jgi:glutaredoxin
MNLQNLPVVAKSGTRNDHEIMVYALSTCGFCKRALAFLDSHEFSYKYLYVDLIPIDSKNMIKQELKARFNENVAFPFAVVDDKKHLVGFIEADWKLTLDV